MMSAKQLDKYRDYVYPLIRIVAGFLFACHGAQKLFGVLGSQPEIHDPEGLVAGLIEFFGGSLVALGLGARAAAFLASGEMAVAYWAAACENGSQITKRKMSGGKIKLTRREALLRHAKWTI